MTSLSSPSSISILFYTLVIFLTTFATISSSYGGNESDHLALLSFKSLVSDPYGALASWNSSSHFCNWSGVSCGKLHRRVTMIQLRSIGPQGSMSHHVGNLSFLRLLSLGNNSFEGTIPHELGRLLRLRSLNLSENKFSGVILANLSGCYNLEELLLGSNNLVGSIPIEISFLSKLTILSLDNNNLTGGIPPFLGNLTSMKAIYISTNPLCGSIPDTLGRLKSSRIFYAHGCNLHGIIPHSIYNLSLLTNFSLAVNQLTGTLPPTIGSMLPNLRFLQLCENQLSGLLPTSISNCSKLNFLKMNENNFSGKLTIDFAKLKDISFISLFNNNFNGGGEANEMKFTIDSLGNCSKLKVLSLGNCNIQGVVPTSMGNLSHQLSYLGFGGNQLYGSLPSSIGNLVGLTSLALEANRFTGKIPSTIGMLQKLKVVSLDENQFLGPIPYAIWNLSMLYWISLSSNRLEGEIPPTMGNCHQLHSLDLSYNKLSGKIPKKLLQLTSLIFLHLSNNNLSSLPTEVQELRSLNVLDLSHNNLSGNIPNSLCGFTSLIFLFINDNLFEGMVPPSLSSLRGLAILDLSENNLSGQIPKFLEWFSLEYLNLSFNDFQGELPVKGVFANASAFSILGNNRLCGGLIELRLPKCKVVEKHNKRFIFLIIVILVSCTVFSVFFFVYAWFKKRRNDQPSMNENERFLKVSYDQLLKATDGFSEANLIGQGGSSSVYKGTLDDKFVAVKVLHLQIRGALKRFETECEAWRNIRHRNLLKMITLCSSIDFQGNDFKAFVYELMPNGSLHDWLHSNAHTSKLDLFQRINILIDVACALDYLHNQCLPTVVHGDMKPSNILLDNDMVAHVGDFGVAKFLGTSSNQTNSNGVIGTIGYVLPEYDLGNKMACSGDVYSFGILLLEVMTGKKPTDDIFNEDLSLHKFAYTALLDQVINVIDSDVVMQSTEANVQKMEECLASTIRIGVSCSIDSPSQRMNINNVVHELLHVRDALQNLEVPCSLL